MKKSRKKNYISLVNGAVYRHLIGRNIKKLELIKKNGKEFYFFSNAKSNHNINIVLDEVMTHSNSSLNHQFVFGLFTMKNNKEYLFLCEISSLYINSDITQIDGIKVLLTKKFSEYAK